MMYWYIRFTAHDGSPRMHYQPEPFQAPAGWTRVDRAGLDSALDAHEADRLAWEALPKPPPDEPALPELRLRSPDGSVFRLVIDNTGRVSGVRL